LTAVNERPEKVMAKHFAKVDQPTLWEPDDIRRYVHDLERLYGQGLLAMYERIASHGPTVCELTDEAEITERVQKIMALVALDGDDVPKILVSLENAAQQLNRAAVIQLFATIQNRCR
jgi:hypothetical protein